MHSEGMAKKYSRDKRYELRFNVAAGSFNATSQPAQPIGGHRFRGYPVRGSRIVESPMRKVTRFVVAGVNGGLYGFIGFSASFVVSRE
jgi:hypothetical protein